MPQGARPPRSLVLVVLTALTLIAFARDDRFNVYAGAERVAFSESAGRRARTPAPVEPGSRPPMEARG